MHDLYESFEIVAEVKMIVLIPEHRHLYITMIRKRSPQEMSKQNALEIELNISKLKTK